MKRKIIMYGCLMLMVSLWAKPKDIAIKEYDWGFEIQNITTQKIKICNNNFFIRGSTPIDIMVYYKCLAKGDSYTEESLWDEYYNQKLPYVLFKSGKPEEIQVNLKQKMKEYEKIIIIPDYSFSFIRAFCDNNDLHLTITSDKDSNKTQFCLKLEEIQNEFHEKLEKEKLALEEQERLAKEKRINDFKKNGGEGYDNLLWGTTLEEFLNIYSQEAEIQKTKYEPVITMYRRKLSEDEYMDYFFYNDKLYSGRTTFYNLNDEAKAGAIGTRLTELYGKTSKQNLPDNPETKIANVWGNKIVYLEYSSDFWWNKTPTFTVHYNITSISAKYREDAASVAVFITSSPNTGTLWCSNEKIEKEVEKYKKEYEKKQEQEELKKEKDKLNF